MTTPIDDVQALLRGAELAPLRDAARRRDSAWVIRELNQLALRRPEDWPGVLVRAQSDWGDDGVFVMQHVVLYDGNAVRFERRERGSG